MESLFTSVVNCEIRFTPYSLDFSDFMRKHTKNRENCHSQMSCFTQNVKRKITFMLNSLKFDHDMSPLCSDAQVLICNFIGGF